MLVPGVGFEPTRPYYGPRVFKTLAATKISPPGPLFQNS